MHNKKYIRPCTDERFLSLRHRLGNCRSGMLTTVVNGSVHTMRHLPPCRWRPESMSQKSVSLRHRLGVAATHLTLKPMGADTRAAKNRSLWGCVKTKNSTFLARVSVLIKYRNWYILRIRFGKNRRLWRCVKTKNSTFPVKSISHHTFRTQDSR